MEGMRGWRVEMLGRRIACETGGEGCWAEIGHEGPDSWDVWLKKGMKDWRLGMLGLWRA